MSLSKDRHSVIVKSCLHQNQQHIFTAFNVLCSFDMIDFYLKEDEKSRRAAEREEETHR